MTILTNLGKLGFGMADSDSVIPLDSFVTFGDLLKYLRRRARLTQRELSIAVGYSEAQISRLEQNQRPPDLASLTALFIPALYIDDEPLIVSRLMELAAQARGEELPPNGVVTFSSSTQKETRETVRIEATQNNLPLQLTSFIGRESEIAEIQNLLDKNRGKARLVTLTGSGGCGKTRLALEVAAQLTRAYRDGTWLIEVASISDPELVLQTISSTLGIPEARDVPPIRVLTNFLQSKEILLIFDNCEQAVSRAARLAQEILRACPHVRILATSREILNNQAETRFQVPSLSLPQEGSSSGEVVSKSESARLFVERAQAALPSFALTEENASSVMRICRRLDGIPLAIELAAARMTTLSAREIAARLDDSIQLLTMGKSSLPHHQTLEAAIDWSYELLSEPERVLLQRLSVFSNGWTLEAAEAAASDPFIIPRENTLDLLTQLVNKSLVIVDFQTQGETRYRLLETVREYAHKRLIRSGEAERIENQRFDFFFSLVERAEIGFKSADHQLWLRRLALEQDNLRAALAHGQARERFEETLQFAGTLFWFWQTVGNIGEGRSHVERILAASESTSAGAARAKALWTAGSLAWIQADYIAARPRLEESVRLWRALKAAGDAGLAVALRELGILAIYQGEADYALSVLEESLLLLQESDRLWDLALAFYNRGLVYEVKNDVGTAREDFEKCLALFRRLNEPWGLAVSLNGLGRIAGRQASYDAARSYLEESLKLSRMLEDPWSIATTLYLLGETAFRQKNMEEAINCYAQSLALNRTVGDRAMIGFTLHNLGKIARLQGELQRAARLFGAAKALGGDVGVTTSWSLTNHNERERDIAVIRAGMDEEAFEPAWKEGQAMSADEAMEYALTLSIQ